MTNRVEGLDPSRHERSNFACGNPALDDWLRRFAHQHDARINTSRTWVAVDDELDPGMRGTRPILGYVSLAAHAVRLDDAAAAIPTRALPDPIPAAIITRIAVDQEHQGRQLGRRLLRFAVERVLDANEQVALTLVVVDAIDGSAADFYERHGFHPLPGRRRLIARVSDLAAMLRD